MLNTGFRSLNDAQLVLKKKKATRTLHRGQGIMYRKLDKRRNVECVKTQSTFEKDCLSFINKLRLVQPKSSILNGLYLFITEQQM